MEGTKLKFSTVATCVALAVLIVGYFFFNNRAPHGSASASPGSRLSGSVSEKSFKKVAGSMARKGIKSRVAPNQMDVFHFYLSAPVAHYIALEDAKHLAVSTRKKLGGEAAVYILSPSGAPLAAATPSNP